MPPRRRAVHPLPIAALLTIGVIAAAAPMPVAAASRWASADASMVASCNANLRSDPSTRSQIEATIPAGSNVTIDGTTTGGSWITSCGGSISGTTWYLITSVNGVSARSLFGETDVYAATQLFRVAGTSVDWLEGVDISVHQGTVDFAQVRSAGKRFVFAKASEGIGFADSRYQANRAGAMSNDLAFSPYHFARPDLNPGNPAGEADWFADTMGLAHGMLLPVLDLEVRGSLSPADLTAWVRTFVERVYERTGARPMIYVSPSFWKTRMGDSTWFTENGYQVLWIAHWTTAAAPTVPAANWGGQSWSFWQYTNCGHVTGISACVDLDRFNGFDMASITW